MNKHTLVLASLSVLVLAGCEAPAEAPSPPAPAAEAQFEDAGVDRGGAQKHFAAFFGWMDLDCPGLEKVRAAVGRGDYAAAAAHYAAHLAARTKPVYFAWEKERPAYKPGPDAEKEWEKLLRHDFNFYNMIDNPGHPDIDWDHLPPTQDLEYKWCLNRHTFWHATWGHKWFPDKSLGGAYNATRDEKYAASFARQLESWLDSSRVPFEDRDWRGRFRTIEVGIRLSTSWPAALYTFRGSKHFPPLLQCRMVKSIVEQARYLMRYHSHGNWGDMEANGLVYSGVLFPEFCEAASWREQGTKWLVESLARDVYPDGAQKELTTSYHNVTLANQYMAASLLKANGYPAPMEAGLERMYEADMWNMRPDGTLPLWNDSDIMNYRDWLQVGADLFGRKDFLYLATEGREGEAPQKTAHRFEYGGWAISRSGWDKGARYLAIDLGPFGIGHQHEDKLTVDCFAYGQAMVVDPGRFTYGRSPYGAHFRSSFAHNLILVDGMEQNRRTQKQTYRTEEPLRDVGALVLPGFHYVRGVYADGFGPKNDKSVTHHRQVAYVRGNPDYWVIHDTLTGTGEHLFEQLWHLTPCEAEEAGPGAVEARWKAARLRMLFPGEGNEIEIVEGREEPAIQGWYSREYEIREPAPCVVVRRKAACPAVFTTVLFPSVQLREDLGAEALSGEKAAGVKVKYLDRNDVILFSLEKGTHRVGEYEFKDDVWVFRN